ncbi:MAG TPA: hypothetical protein VGR40_09790 [Candidatus Binatus sp.]|nr:hypothetical protein [Candidatus Binatus sp.]
MKKGLLLSLAITIVCLVAGGIYAQEQKVGLLNETGHVITAVYLSPHGDANWHSNRLSSPLDNDDLRTLDFSQSGASNCLFDFAVVLDNGQRWQQTDGYNLCQTDAIGLGPDGHVVTANAID